MQGNQEDKLLLSKIFDKIKFCKQKNKITNSFFLNEYEVSLIMKELVKNKVSNYFFEGGYENARK